LTEDINQLDDQNLLSSFRLTQDNHYIGVLFTRYSLMVFGVCMKYLKNKSDAQDAAQQVFEKAYKVVGKYEIPYFKSWIYTVARNISLMRLRNLSTDSASIEEISEIADENNAFEQDLKLTEYLKETQLKQLYEALTHLNTEQQLCLKKFYFEKKSYQVIQNETGLTFQQVKSHIQNGKRRLRILLEKKSLLHERH
jgi:RNA polymerase sigma-70 factor (ECF subfamily)